MSCILVYTTRGSLLGLHKVLCILKYTTTYAISNVIQSLSLSHTRARYIHMQNNVSTTYNMWSVIQPQSPISNLPVSFHQTMAKKTLRARPSIDIHISIQTEETTLHMQQTVHNEPRIVTQSPICMILGSVYMCQQSPMYMLWGGYDWQAPQNYTSLLQNIISFIGLFCTRDL